MTTLAIIGAGKGLGAAVARRFGREGYAILMGRLALPTLLATAAAPLVGAWLLDGLGPDGTLKVLFGAALVTVVLVLPLLPIALRPSRPV